MYISIIIVAFLKNATIEYSLIFLNVSVCVCVCACVWVGGCGGVCVSTITQKGLNVGARILICCSNSSTLGICNQGQEHGSYLKCSLFTTIQSIRSCN